MRTLTQEIYHEGCPDWFDGERIDEMVFCQDFLAKYPMKCVHDRLFTVDGAVEDERKIGQIILQEISGYVTSGLARQCWGYVGIQVLARPMTL